MNNATYRDQQKYDELVSFFKLFKIDVEGDNRFEVITRGDDYGFNIVVKKKPNESSVMDISEFIGSYKPFITKVFEELKQSVSDEKRVGDNLINTAWMMGIKFTPLSREIYQESTIINFITEMEQQYHFMDLLQRCQIEQYSEILKNACYSLYMKYQFYEKTITDCLRQWLQKPKSSYHQKLIESIVMSDKMKPFNLLLLLYTELVYSYYQVLV